MIMITEMILNNYRKLLWNNWFFILNARTFPAAQAFFLTGRALSFRMRTLRKIKGIGLIVGTRGSFPGFLGYKTAHRSVFSVLERHEYTYAAG